MCEALELGYANDMGVTYLNWEKELEFLEMALPIMEHFYGSEHPKVIDAKKRKNKG